MADAGDDGRPQAAYLQLPLPEPLENGLPLTTSETTGQLTHRHCSKVLDQQVQPVREGGREGRVVEERVRRGCVEQRECTCVWPVWSW